MKRIQVFCVCQPNRGCVGQVEFNPFQQPRTLASYCHEHGIVVGGWAPLAKATQVRQCAPPAPPPVLGPCFAFP